MSLLQNANLGATHIIQLAIPSKGASMRILLLQYTNAYIWNLENGNNNPVYETAKETLMYRSLMDSVGEGEVGRFGRMALKHVKYHV